MKELRKFKKWFWIAAVGWTALICASFGWNSWQSWRSILNQGKSEAKMAFLKDISYRTWNASHGGVYVPITAENQPNPYLQVPDRDVVTTSGQKLTLINPAYMTRQVFTRSAEKYGIRGHITSLQPINPGNAPDAWEKRVLQGFETNPADITELAVMEGKPFLRFMRVMFTEDACLKCHGQQGYKTGDIRGGISVAVPMASLMADAKKSILFLGIAHGIFLILGLAGLVFSHRKVVHFFVAGAESKKKAEEEKEKLKVTLRSIGDAVITTDLNGKIVLINKGAENLTGWSQEEASGRPLPEVFMVIDERTGKPCENPVHQVLASGSMACCRRNTALVAREGSRRSIAASGAPILGPDGEAIGVVLVSRDITEEKKSTEELLKIKKLESVGVLAGGIAHDFNNLLTAILGNINLAEEYIDRTNDAQPLLEEARKASLRARDLTRQLLTFSKGGNPVKKTTSIKQIITESADFVLHGSPVTCRFDIPDDVWLVDIDAGQMSQVIQNLVINARHALPEGGELTISCANFVAGPEEAAPDLPVGKYIKIVARDNGAGIPEHYLDKIFDPYFSTKREGSGLGLAVAHSIISKHAGRMGVQSEIGEGSTFTIYLPAAAVQLLPAAAPDPGEGPQRKTGGAKVLVMDDEPVIREVIRKMLYRLGQEVLLASDGREAIEIFREQRQSARPVDLVIMDLTIPGGLGGKEAVQEILRIDPKARVIVSSGYANDPIMADFRVHGFRAAIAKPFLLEDLEKTMQEVLEEAAA